MSSVEEAMPKDINSVVDVTDKIKWIKCILTSLCQHSVAVLQQEAAQPKQPLDRDFICSELHIAPPGTATNITLVTMMVTMVTMVTMATIVTMVTK